MELGSNSMSSDLYHHLPEMQVFSDSTTDLLFSPDTIFPEISSINQNPIEELDSNCNSLDQFSSPFFSSSPPSSQFQSLSLYPPNPIQMQNLSNGYGDFGGLSEFPVKNEEFHVGFDAYSNSFAPRSYSGAENVTKYMQRSFSDNSYEGKSGFLFQPRFDSLTESPNFQNSPENSFFEGQIRRVCSTGDLQNMRQSQSTQRSFSSPLAAESTFMEDSNNKVGRYSAEERKERISKYRAKRNQRNFNKTIKYACRKTLADNRPRIRGRFARNDETGEIPKVSCSTRDDDEDELWFDGMHEFDDGTMRRGGTYGGNYVPPQFQYYGCF